MPAALAELCFRLSVRAPVAYVQAEYFGGSGDQGIVPIAGPGQAAPAEIGDNAINHALRWLGVRRGDCRDEFESVGLDACRDTDRWLDHD